MKKIYILIPVMLFVFLLSNNSQAQTLVANAGLNTTICNGQTVNLGGSPTATGGTEPYTYLWSPATNLNYSDIANPIALPTATTTYTVVVTDDASNSASASVTITVNPVPVANAGDNHTICAGNCVTLIASGGTSYFWSNGLGSAANPGPTVCPTSTVTYTVTVVANGCSATDDVTITVNPHFGISLNVTNAMCGHQNGSISVSPLGGTPPFNYMWNSTQWPNTSTITNLPAGNYTVTVFDAVGCKATATGTVINIPNPYVITTVTPASCGLCNGSATIQSTSGTNYTYHYLWSNGATSQTVTGLCHQNYSVTVTDGNGCFSTRTVEIGNNNSLSVVLDTLINANCANNTLGMLAVHGGCGAGGYTYQWFYNGAITGYTTDTINNLTAGIYKVKITDANNDTVAASFPLSNTNNIYASITTTNANCSDNGTATLQVQGVHPPFTYLWSDSLHQTTPVATGLTQGTYMVTITDSIGCTLIANANILSGCLNTIMGRIYLDANQNCVQDSGEAGIPNKVLYAQPGYHYGSTNASGDFKITTPDMNNTLYSPSFMAPYSLTCPSTGSYTIDFTNIGDTSFANNFGYYANPNYFNLVIHPGWSGANPGFNKHYWILYYNNSLSTQNVLIRFTYDSLLQYTSCTQGGIHYPAEHKIEWTINNVPPNNIWSWNNKPDIYFYVPTSVAINTLLHSCFEILPIVGDAYPPDNTVCTEEVVTGSHDPNSKSVFPVGKSAEGLISTSDSTLFYTIHFQNDGNDTAFTVVVVDTLSPYLDPATVVPGAASHPYKFDLSGQGILTFRFDNILLPDSNVNEPASNGYVNFSVKQKSDNPLGTVITNTASNYFDFNPPVNTNTVKNTISILTYISEDLTNNNLKIFPNPFRNAFTIEILNKEEYPCKITVYSSLSEVVKTVLLTNSKNTITTDNWSQGFYFYVVKNKNGNVIGKGKIVQQ